MDATFLTWWSAIEKSDITLVTKIFLENPRYLHATNTLGQSPMAYAADKGNMHLLTTLLSFGANINIQTALGWTPLMYACRKAQTNMVSFLLRHDADVNLQTYFGDSALLISISNKNKDIVQLLLHAGAFVNVRDSNGWSALVHAIFRGQIDIMTFLLQLDADVNDVFHPAFLEHIPVKIFGNSEIQASIEPYRHHFSPENLTQWNKLKLKELFK